MRIIALTTPQPTKRPLKIYCAHAKIGINYKPVPEIRLKGKWLQELGFKKGENITLFINQERILKQKKKV